MGKTKEHVQVDSKGNKTKVEPAKDEKKNSPDVNLADANAKGDGGVIEQKKDEAENSDVPEEKAFPDIPLPAKGDPGASICDWLESLPDFFINFGEWCVNKLDVHVFHKMEVKAQIRAHEKKTLEGIKTKAKEDQAAARKSLEFRGDKDKIDITKAQLLTFERTKSGKERLVEIDGYKLTKSDLKNIVDHEGKPFNPKGKSSDLVSKELKEVMDRKAEAIRNGTYKVPKRQYGPIEKLQRRSKARKAHRERKAQEKAQEKANKKEQKQQEKRDKQDEKILKKEHAKAVREAKRKAKKDKIKQEVKQAGKKVVNKTKQGLQQVGQKVATTAKKHKQTLKQGIKQKKAKLQAHQQNIKALIKSRKLLKQMGRKPVQNTNTNTNTAARAAQANKQR